MMFSDGIHLISDEGVNALHDYCAKIGIKRCWFHHSSHPHYDIPKRRRKSFFKDHPDVKEVTAREIVKILQSNARRHL